MNLIKPIKKFRITITVLLLLVIFRGSLFRLCVNYTKISSRPYILVTNTELKKSINDRISGRVLTTDEIIDLSLKLTTHNLHFSFDHISSNPNESFKTHKANCIGYAAMVNSIGNYIAAQQGMENEIKFHHQVGKIDVFGFDINAFLNIPFFKNHDYNEIVIHNAKSKIQIDATVADYLLISRIN